MIADQGPTTLIFLYSGSVGRAGTLQFLRLSVGVTCDAYRLGIEGLYTQGSRRGRTVGEPVGGIIEIDSSDFRNEIRYQTFDTRPDTEFKVERR